jgi:hypothetical protein
MVELQAEGRAEEPELEEGGSQLGIWIASVGGMILVVGIASFVVMARAKKA